LTAMNACRPAVEWAETQRNMRQAWRDCERGDWMIWLLWMTTKPGSTSRMQVVLASCDCASLARKWWPKKDPRPAQAIRVARRLARGKARAQEAEAASKAASEAAWAASQAASEAAWAASKAAFEAAHEAAWAASQAAWAASRAAWDASQATQAAWAAWAAAWAASQAASQAASETASQAASQAAHEAMLRRCARLVRKRFPNPPRPRGKEVTSMPQSVRKTISGGRVLKGPSIGGWRRSGARFGNARPGGRRSEEPGTMKLCRRMRHSPRTAPPGRCSD